MYNQDKNSSKKVVVALTGRVDSAVAAFLLKKQGYDVMGLAMITGPSGDTAKEKPKCYIENMDKVQDLCEQMKIPFYVSDIKAEYEYEVIDRLMENKLNALSNSSCFQCTSVRMKILLRKMKALNADFIATGHYCKVHQNFNSNEYHIHSNNNAEVDQSILLAGLDQDILSHLILPLGELRKEEVLKIAKNFGLHKNPSIIQEGFCFKTVDSVKELIKKNVAPSLIKEGNFISMDGEITYGEHDGIVNHFIGQKELSIENGMKLEKTLQIVDYRAKTGDIILGEDKDLLFGGAQLTQLNTSVRLDKRKPIQCYVKFKFSNEHIKAHIFFKNNNSAYIEFNEPISPLLKREQMVIFDSDKRNAKVIGTAMVNSRGEFKSVDRVAVYRKGETDDNEVHTDFKF
jgi:tRNA-specific 2-thiouridylase